MKPCGSKLIVDEPCRRYVVLYEILPRPAIAISGDFEQLRNAQRLCGSKNDAATIAMESNTRRDISLVLSCFLRIVALSSRPVRQYN